MYLSFFSLRGIGDYLQLPPIFRDTEKRPLPSIVSGKDLFPNYCWGIKGSHYFPLFLNFQLIRETGESSFPGASLGYPGSFPVTYLLGEPGDIENFSLALPATVLPMAIKILRPHYQE